MTQYVDTLDSLRARLEKCEALLAHAVETNGLLVEQRELERAHCDEWHSRAETAEDEVRRLKT